MNAIEIIDLTKKYKNITAVNNVTLNIEKNKLISILGTNGAGKTTIIKILSTLIKKTSGTIKIFDMEIEKDNMKIKEIINVSPQETAIAKNLTVIENLYFMAGIYQIKNKEEKINQLIENFNLKPILKQKANTLSGGWQRKLSIALALINDPKILFLDEPTLGLDVIARKELWNIIEKLKKEKTIILTTHYMEEAYKLSDKIAIMNKGKLLEVDTPDKIIAKTKTNNFEDAFLKVIEKGE